MNCFCSQLCSYHIRTQLLQFQGKGTDTDGGSQLIGFFVSKISGDLASAICNCRLYGRSTDNIAVIDNGDLLSEICLGCLGKFLCTVIRQGKFYNVLSCLCHLVRSGTSLCICYIGSFQNYRSIRSRELQRTWFSKLCQNGICITDTRNLNIDTVGTFLVNLSLSTVAFYTLLKFIHRICHIFYRRCFVTNGLIGNADTTCQIESQFDVFC